MNRSVRRSLLVLCVLFSLPAAATAQPESSDALREEWRFGYHLFELLFKHRGLTPLTNVRAALTSTPEKTVIVLLGPHQEGWMWGEMIRFVQQGGALLVATDNTLAVGSAAFFRRGPIEVLAERDAYQGYRDCPRVTDVDNEHPVTRGVRELIPNRSGWLGRLSNTLGDWEIVARLPPNRPTIRPEPLIAVMRTRAPAPGQLVVVADHSLFTNGMLWHGDNAILAVNLVNWLAEADRERVLILADGQVGAGSWPPPQLPEQLPTPDLDNLPDLTTAETLRFMNNLVTGLEDSDLFNEFATSRWKFVSDPVYKRSLLLLLAAAAALFLLWRFGQGTAPRRQQSPPREMANVSTLRIQSRLAAGEYHVAARQLAQDMLVELTGSTEPLSWRFPPRQVEILGHLFLRQRVREDLVLVQNLAVNDRRRVARREFRRLARSLARLRQMHHQGRIGIPAQATGIT